MDVRHYDVVGMTLEVDASNERALFDLEMRAIDRYLSSAQSAICRHLR